MVSTLMDMPHIFLRIKMFLPTYFSKLLGIAHMEKKEER